MDIYNLLEHIHGGERKANLGMAGTIRSQKQYEKEWKGTKILCQIEYSYQ